MLTYKTMLEDCVNAADPFTSKNFTELPLAEQLSVVRLRSALHGKNYCFEKRVLEEALESNQTLVNPFTNEPVIESLQDSKLKESVQAENASTLVRDLGVASCKDIRRMLENSKMTKEEQLVFLKQHQSSSKSLRSFVAKQHMGVSDLKYYSNVGSKLMNIITNHAKETCDMLFDQPFDNSDPDCVYLKSLLDQLEKDVGDDNTTGKPSPSDSKVLGYLKKGAATAAKYAWKGVKTIGSYAYNMGVFAVTFLTKKAFELWAWISSSPKTAFFALTFLKGYRNKMCRLAGSTLGYFGPQTSKQWMIEKIQQHYPDYVPGASTTTDDLKEVLGSVSKQVVTDVVIKSGGEVVKTMWSAGGRFFAKALSTSITFLPVPGALSSVLASAVETVVTNIVDGAEEDVAFLQEQVLYTKQLNEAAGELFDVINPVRCMDEVTRSFAEVVLPNKDSTYAASKLGSRKDAYLSSFKRSTLHEFAVRRARNMANLHKKLSKVTSKASAYRTLHSAFTAL